ncbi:RVP_2 domain-containing protein [Gossypium australe]|uniref:RVP_2 domain-containing protein n=1 Tax=Gossypium australe TaxID=47621 RepID=A0A5B6VMK9_9ROSI|nr:RVP_2 domain-containing protein [Gossypium australe]
MSKVAMSVLSPLVCRRCLLEIQSSAFSIDILIMPFVDFDLILGMDWLTDHRVILDCRKKIFSIQGPNGEIVEVNGVTTSVITQIILFF